MIRQFSVLRVMLGHLVARIRRAAVYIADWYTRLRSTKLLVYGLQRSGTNYLQAVIEENFKNVAFVNGKERHRASHKHFRLYDDKTSIPESQYHNDLEIDSLNDLERCLADHEKPDYYVVISKCPYSWFVSYKKWAEKCNWPEPNYHYIREWNLFYRTWLEFAVENPDRVLLVRYVDLLWDLHKMIGNIGKHFDLCRKGDEIMNPEKVRLSARFSLNRTKYYLEKWYLGEIPRDGIRVLNANLDQDLASELGYLVYRVEA